MEQLRIELLGRFRVSVDGRAIADVVWRRRKATEAFALLADPESARPYARWRRCSTVPRGMPWRNRRLEATPSPKE
ncbi:MAG: hypothetical protein ACR2JC_19655 [Chloroflexota bacterium]